MISHGGPAGRVLFSALSRYSEAFSYTVYSKHLEDSFDTSQPDFFFWDPAIWTQNNPTSVLD